MLRKQRAGDLAVTGGSPLFDRIRMTGQLSAPDAEDYLGLVREFLTETRRDYVSELEAALVERHGAKHCVAVTNACLGLVMLLSLNRTPGKDQVLLPSFSYRGLPHLVRWARQHPVFCDVTAEGHTLCPESVARAIDGRTSSVLCVHNVNALCDVDTLQRIADRYDAALVIDSVYALDCELDGKRVGTCGQAEVFSLHATKLLHGFEGGYITTNDDQLAHWLRQLRDNQPVCRDGLQPLAGLDARLHPLHAACALISLERLEETKASNASRYRRYLERFAGIPHLSFASSANLSSNHGLVLLKVEDAFPFSRDEIVRLLRAENALVRPYYDPPLHVSCAHPGDRVDGELVVTQRVRHQFVQMPVGDFVSLEDIDALATFLHFLGENAAAIRCELDALQSPNACQRQADAKSTNKMPGQSRLSLRERASFRGAKSDNQDIEQQIRGIFARRFYANHGPLESRAEQAVADLAGAKYVTAVANGMLAVIFALKAVAAKGKVLLPAFAPTSTVHAAIWAGFDPIVVGMAADTEMNLCLAAQAVCDETTALIGVHWNGVPCDTAAMTAFAKQYRLGLIFDARETSLSQANSTRTLTVGDASVLSFDRNRRASGMEGGAVATNSEEVSRRIRTMRSFHEKERFFSDCLRINGKISELQAAMILSSFHPGATWKQFHVCIRSQNGIYPVR